MEGEKGKRESVWSREESENRWAHSSGQGQGVGVSAGAPLEGRGAMNQSGRDIFTGEAKDRVRIEDEAWSGPTQQETNAKRPETEGVRPGENVARG